MTLIANQINVRLQNTFITLLLFLVVGLTGCGANRAAHTSLRVTWTSAKPVETSSPSPPVRIMFVFDWLDSNSDQKPPPFVLSSGDKMKISLETVSTPSGAQATFSVTVQNDSQGEKSAATYTSLGNKTGCLPKIKASFYTPDANTNQKLFPFVLSSGDQLQASFKSSATTLWLNNTLDIESQNNNDENLFAATLASTDNQTRTGAEIPPQSSFWQVPSSLGMLIFGFCTTPVIIAYFIIRVLFGKWTPEFIKKSGTSLSLLLGGNAIDENNFLRLFKELVIPLLSVFCAIISALIAALPHFIIALSTLKKKG